MTNPSNPEVRVLRDILPALKRTVMGKCPNCGEGKLFDGYLKVSDTCHVCSEELMHQRADDAPPYFTIFIVGHIVVPLLLLVENMYTPSLWIHFAIWFPFITLLSLVLLRPIKGAVIGFQWANYMHGFDPNGEIETYIIDGADDLVPDHTTISNQN